jgi:hypothetical protein
MREIKEVPTLSLPETQALRQFAYRYIEQWGKDNKIETYTTEMAKRLFSIVLGEIDIINEKRMLKYYGVEK